jgi:hypothetical protein
MECPGCGAQISPDDVRCRYCGSTIPQSAVASVTRRADPTELLKQSKDLEELLRYTPSGAAMSAGMVIMTVFGLIFTSFAVFFITTASRSGAPTIFRLFPFIFVLVGLGIMATGIRGLVKLSTSPLQRVPAVVAGKRQEYSSSSEGSGSTTYYLSIETEDGERKEHRVRGRLHGEVERGDAGVAYLKGGYLIDFKRVRLPEP